MTRFIYIVVLGLIANSTTPAAPETKTASAIIKIRGKLTSQSVAPGSDKPSAPESTEVRVIIGQNSWKIASTEWKYSAPAEIFFDGTDTYRYIISRDFLPGHKLPDDEKIAYTCSIEPGEILPRHFSTDRLLATVYLSGKFKTTDHSLPPIEPNEDAPPTQNFTSTGDRLNALLKATFSPSTSQKALAANLKFPTVAELTATKTKQIADVIVPQSFVCNFYGPSPFVSPTPTNILTTATYTFEADEITLGSPADLAYPIPKGIGSITDLRLKEISRNNLQWLATGARGKVGYEWSDPELPKRDTPNLLQCIPPLIYRGLVIERDGVLSKVDENDPAIPKP